MSESAFKGTVKEGFERRYTIINERDMQKYLTRSQKDKLNVLLNDVLGDIELGRISDNKDPYNNYVVINLDEPYIDEVIDIMKRNGHWG